MNLEIAGRPLGPEHPPFMVAELSGNHRGSLDRALALLQAAVRAGADAVKIQTYRPDTITIDCDRDEFLLREGLWQGRRLYELYQEAHTPWDWHPRLFQAAADLGLPLFSSPFDPSAVDLLESLDCPAYKIASFELVDLGLIRRAAATGRPLILSTGMASLGEIEEAVRAARAAGCARPLLLHCTSGYPTPPGDANLRTLPHLARTFGVPVGLSDHTQGTAAAVAAVALGACLVEKHFTLSRADEGVDAAFSLEPEEFSAMARACRDAWAALGRVHYGAAPSEQAGLAFRRSLYVVRDIEAGAELTPDNVRSVRPGLGLHPRHLDTVLGRTARRALPRGTPLEWSMIGD